MIPFRRWMEIAGGVFGWGEAVFWSTSLQYFLAAIDGWSEVHGAKRQSDVSTEDCREARLEYAADLSLTDDDLAKIRQRQERSP